ncbi:MAG: hypothetical protein KBG28_30305 [Kofleriaceae bacterium]|jgi:hypothetical protein|nr:hypothetical protein [Kofleriaceae bacterium]MBP6839879.1 hypothetical protein [Kofleriaceae bacterium]MBP9208301.1 hypothetical protein [Kofleriaceae bacterium]
MSEPKRPGSRDISDLKARLGLKKGAPGPAGTPAPPGAPTPGPAAAPAPSGGAIAPPPGVAIQPPPGMARPAPAAPAAPPVPSASDDPFGAMNAMAQMGTMQRAPEIVIVNDGKPVEDVAAGKRAATIGKYVAIGILPLIFGVVIGQIAKDGNFYNDGIRGAKAIMGNVKELKKNLGELESILTDSKKSGYRASKDMTAKLGLLLPKLDSKSTIVFRAKQSSMSAELSGQIMSFYAGVNELQSMLRRHVDAAKADDIALAKAKTAGDGAKIAESENVFIAGTIRYAVVLSNPGEEDKATGGPVGAQVVELGPPYCGEVMSKTGACEGSGPSGHAYRPEPSGNWRKGDVVSVSPGDPFPAKVVIPLVSNGTIDGLIRGTQPAVSEAAYVRRMSELSTMLEELLANANAVENKLRAKAGESPKFTFFL